MKSLRLMAIGTILVLIAILFTSCGSTRIIETPVEVETIRTEYINTVAYDSIYLRDSIYIESRNDTVFKTKYIEKYKLKTVYDTIRKTDSIQVPVPITTTITETKEVNKLYWWQTMFMYLGIAATILVSIKLYTLIKK
jgi:hypothetical protein